LAIPSLRRVALGKLDRASSTHQLTLGGIDGFGRPAVGGERERLWQRWRELDKNLDIYAARRPRKTAVVVLEPRSAAT